MQNKRIFFIQMMENFFEQEDLLLISESSEQSNLDPSHSLLIYIKLILNITRKRKANQSKNRRNTKKHSLKYQNRITERGVKTAKNRQK